VNKKLHIALILLLLSAFAISSFGAVMLSNQGKYALTQTDEDEKEEAKKEKEEDQKEDKFFCNHTHLALHNLLEVYLPVKPVSYISHCAETETRPPQPGR
jgi:hypothetical protein